MAKPGGSRRRRQSRARCLGQARDRGFLGRGRADQRHRMARAETGGEPAGFRLSSTTRQAGNGGGDIARLIAVIAKAETGQQPGQIGKAKAQAFHLAMAPNIERLHRKLTGRAIGRCIKAAFPIQKGRQVEHKTPLSAGIAPDLGPGRAAPGQNQGTQASRQAFRRIGAIQQAKAPPAERQALNPGLCRTW